MPCLRIIRLTITIFSSQSGDRIADSSLNYSIKRNASDLTLQFNLSIRINVLGDSRGRKLKSRDGKAFQTDAYIGACANEKFSSKKARNYGNIASLNDPSFLLDDIVNPYRAKESRMHVHNAARSREPEVPTLKRLRAREGEREREFVFRSRRTTGNKISRRNEIPWKYR